MNDIELLKNSHYFDAEFYRQEYPDTAQVDSYLHYLEFGGLECRKPSAFFDPIAYWAAYPDVQQARIIPLIHFLRHGLMERRWAGLVPPIAAHSHAQKLSAFNAEDIAMISASHFFDSAWYCKMHGDLGGHLPAEHYARVGAASGLSPGPAFDGPSYLQLHRDIGAMNPLLHYLRNGRSEGRSLGIPSSTKAVIRRELPALAQMEPDLMSDSRLFDGLDALPSISSMPCNTVAERWRQLWVQVGANTKHLVFVPWLVRGGADLAAVNVVKALQRRAGMDSVVIVATDKADAPAADWLPDGTRFVRFVDTETSLSLNETKTLVERLIWALRPESVFNINSRACWEAMAQTGRPLSRMTRLNALLFCRDYSADGRAAGYSDTHFRAALPHLHRVYFDTRYFIQELSSQYGLPSDLAAKLQYLPQPSLGTPTVRSARCAAQRPRVLWAGRFVAQKNTELLMKIAYEGAAFDFDIWGSGHPEIEAQLRKLAVQRPNIRLRGAFASLDELPLNEYVAFLFTSHYEGMPTIILNIAATGLPIVATTVGGVGEIVDEDTGWPVADRHDPRPYLAALAHIATGTALVRQKVENLFKRLHQERSLEAFERELSE